MAFEYEGETYTNETLQQSLNGDLGDEAQQWALQVYPSLNEQGYFHDPELFNVGEEEAPAEEGQGLSEIEQRLADLEAQEEASRDIYSYEELPDAEPELPEIGGPEWVAEMQFKIERLEEGLGRKLTEAEGTALVTEVEGMGKIPELRDVYGPDIAARESTPEGRRQVMAEEVEDNLHHNGTELAAPPPEPKNAKEEAMQEMTEALEADQAGVAPEPVLVGGEEEQESE
jgi:hypothetical protein